MTPLRLADHLRQVPGRWLVPQQTGPHAYVRHTITGYHMQHAARPDLMLAHAIRRTGWDLFDAAQREGWPSVTTHVRVLDRTVLRDWLDDHPDRQPIDLCLEAPAVLYGDDVLIYGWATPAEGATA